MEMIVCTFRPKTRNPSHSNIIDPLEVYNKNNKWQSKISERNTESLRKRVFIIMILVN